MKRKLSKIGWLVVISCVVLIGGPACAQIIGFKPGSEPDGFRGIKWGQDISTVKGLVYVATDPSYGGIDYYIREGDELKMGHAKLERIVYGFWENKFSDVKISTKGYTNWSRFKAIVFEKFGEGYQSNKYIEEYIWVGEKTWMILDYNEFSEEGLLWMTSTQMLTLREEWEKEQAKKGAEEGW
ncbi:MAG TPA: hypothetical protein PK233_08910 [Candidatus Atribacteria bacterium]|mgnify:CR=1 FL=1|nr:hypothetical protein [Candidatus Atribacteria bacterium]